MSYTLKGINAFTSLYTEHCCFSSYQSAADFSIASCFPRVAAAEAPPWNLLGEALGLTLVLSKGLSSLTLSLSEAAPHSPPTSHTKASKATAGQHRPIPGLEEQSQATHLPHELLKQTSAQ